MSIDLKTANELIIEHARKLVNQLIEHRGHDIPPFLSEEYARLRGVKNVMKADLGETSGVLMRLEEGSVIKVNQNQNQARQNFSCAHEIGHILFGELKLGKYLNTTEHRTFNPQAQSIARAATRERLCDAAATELLMPESIFLKYLADLDVSIHSIERMADIFKVSIQAAARRIAEVSFEPCIMLVWKYLPKNKTLQLAWSVGPRMQSQSKTQFKPVHTKIKYPSILHKAYEQDSLVKCYKKFKIIKEDKLLQMESKGFGRGENRYVVSLAFVEK